MNTLGKTALMAVAAIGIGGGAGMAQAQAWGGYGQGWGNGYGRGDDAWRARAQADFLCSGQRARALEARLAREVNEGDIDPRRADRIHDAIDRLEGQQRYVCGNGDWRGVNGLNFRFDRIEGWINAEARQGGYGRRGWGQGGWGQGRWGW